MRYDPPAFAQIVIDRRGPSALSPHPAGVAWQGILVAAPTTVFFRAGSPLVVPVAVTIQLEVPPRPTRERVSATVTDESTGQSQREPIEPIVDNESELTGQDDVPARPPRRPPGQQLATTYLHPDLAAHLTIPARPGRYRVVVQFRGHASAPHVITLAPEP
jgi:hypothetical protein